ncbi:hypothetical protein Tco_0324747 [Tanacetum coccineum]
MLDHSNAETIGRLLNVLCQVGVTTVLANFMLLDVPVDRDVPIISGRSFMYTYGAIMNTLKGKMTTFDGFVHQRFRVTKVRNVHEESDSDDDEEYLVKRDEFGNPFYGPHHPQYLEMGNGTMSCAETIKEILELKLIKVGGNEEVFSSEAWRRALILLARKFRLLNDEVLDGLRALILFRSLDATTLKELIRPDGRMCRMEVRQGVLERMARKQSYHSDRYTGVFEHIVRHYGEKFNGEYASPGYDEQQ